MRRFKKSSLFAFYFSLKKMFVSSFLLFIFHFNRNLSFNKNFSFSAFHLSFKMVIIFHFSFFTYHSNAQTLENYIEIATNNNSMIKVKTADYELAKEKVNEVGTYENTTINLEFFALTPETRVGSQLFKVGANQKLPWFGEFEIKKDEKRAVSKIKEYDIVLSEREITYQVKQAYYMLYEQLAITEILKENKLVLKTYENMALAALSNNRATMSDVLRIRVQKNELHSKVFQNINSLEVLNTNFNRLLQQDKDIANTIADSLNVLDILIPNSRVNKHPLLEKIKAKENLYKTQSKKIDLSKKPKLSVGLDYINVRAYDNISPNQNGKDVWIPKLSLGIPIFNKRFSSQYKQIQIKEAILNEEITNQKLQLEIALDQEKLNLDNAILTVVAAQKNKTEIQRAINVDLKAYETGILNYDKILRLQLQKIRFQLMEIEATKKAFVAKAKVAYLTN